MYVLKGFGSPPIVANTALIKANSMIAPSAMITSSSGGSWDWTSIFGGGSSAAVPTAGTQASIPGSPGAMTTTAPTVTPWYKTTLGMAGIALVLGFIGYKFILAPKGPSA